MRYSWAKSFDFHLILTFSFAVQIYGFSWVVLVGFVMLFKVSVVYPMYLDFWLRCLNDWLSIGFQIFSFSPKKSRDFQLVMRFMQGVISIALVVALCLVVAFTALSIPDLFACVLAFIPTVWAILCVSYCLLYFLLWISFFLLNMMKEILIDQGISVKIPQLGIYTLLITDWWLKLVLVVETNRFSCCLVLLDRKGDFVCVCWYRNLVEALSGLCCELILLDLSLYFCSGYGFIWFSNILDSVFVCVDTASNNVEEGS